MSDVVLPANLEQLLPYYQQAGVLLVSLNDPERESPVALFGLVTLHPTEVPSPPAQPSLNKVISSKEVWLHRTTMSAQEAIDWYKLARNGTCNTLVPGGALVERLGPVGEEPPWPIVALHNRSAPFVPASRSGTFVQHSLSLIEPAEFPLGDEQTRKTIEETLSFWLHFDVDKFEEFLGSVSLVAPNPILRNIWRSPVRAPGEHATLLRMESRAGVDCVPLTVVSREKRNTTIRVQSQVLEPDVTHRVIHSSEPEAVGFTILHPELGALYAGEPYPFFGGVNVTVNNPPPHRVVHTKKGEFEVPQRPVFDQPSHSTAETATQKLYGAANARRTSRPGGSIAQFIANDAAHAFHFAQGLVHSAERRVFIVDPYFRHSDIDNFVRVVASTQVVVTVLASTLGFQDDEQSDAEQATVEQRRAQARQSIKRIDELKRQGLQVELLLMRTRSNPCFHDRFIVADEHAWSLGGSLADLGKRMSLVLAVPDPKPLIDLITHSWKSAEPLAAWANET